MIRTILIFVLLALSGLAAAADSYPTRPVRLIAPFSGGGGDEAGKRQQHEDEYRSDHVGS